MMQNADVKILKAVEVAGVDQNNKPAKTVSVSFMVGDHGPFTETFPRADFDGNAAKMKLQAFAQSLAQLGG